MATNIKFDMKSFNEWLATRPQVIQEMAKQCPPNKLYRNKTNNHSDEIGNRLVLYSYYEDRTVTVSILKEYNPRMFLGDLSNRDVFGISIDDLEECELHPDFDNSKLEWSPAVTIEIPGLINKGT